MLNGLSYVYGGLGRFRGTRWTLRAPWVRRPGRAWLRREILGAELPRADTIGVIFGVRNRADHRILNALRSIRLQSYPAHLVEIVVIDYGSNAESAQRTAQACGEFGAEYLRISQAPVWSRARCLNVGIRRARTKFLMTSDVDIVLSPHYLSDAVEVLRARPLSVVCSAMLDLPEESTESFLESASARTEPALESWRERCTPRFNAPFHPGVAVTFTAFYQTIRGYDEYYELWGAEDDDLMRRFGYLGLDVKVPDTRSFYLHQWHPKLEGVDYDGASLKIARNHRYFETHHSILRNDSGWGLPGEPDHDPSGR